MRLVPSGSRFYVACRTQTSRRYCGRYSGNLECPATKHPALLCLLPSVDRGVDVRSRATPGFYLRANRSKEAWSAGRWTGDNKGPSNQHSTVIPGVA